MTAEQMYDLRSVTEVMKGKSGWADDLSAALDEIERLQHALAECYRLSGADPDGNEDWRLAPRAVKEGQTNAAGV